jgi:hypothetical protein
VDEKHLDVLRSFHEFRASKSMEQNTNFPTFTDPGDSLISLKLRHGYGG